jgi:hypothetical protein
MKTILKPRYSKESGVFYVLFLNEKDAFMKKTKSVKIFFFIILFFMFTAGLDCELLGADIKVYDAHDHYLGLFVDLTSSNITIFLPTLGVFVWLTTPASTIPAGNLFSNDYPSYESTDCSGTPYGGGFVPSLMQCGVNYCYPDINKGLKTITAKSVNMMGTCHSTTYSSSLYPLIEIPAGSLPFTFPVILPLHFQYSSMDLTGDGKIGLDDVIKALQIMSGIR